VVFQRFHYKEQILSFPNTRKNLNFIMKQGEYNSPVSHSTRLLDKKIKVSM